MLLLTFVVRRFDAQGLFNVNKCCYLIFSRKGLPSTPDTPPVVSNDYPLSRMDNFKYYGVGLSADFTWDKHIMFISYKTRKLPYMAYFSGEVNFANDWYVHFRASIFAKSCRMGVEWPAFRVFNFPER